MINTPSIINSHYKNFKDAMSKNWDNLTEPQKSVLLKIWKVITYKWQLQILFNTPFLIYWILDKKVDSIHQFNIELLTKLNIPEWMTSMIGINLS